MTQAPFLSASWYRVAKLKPKLAGHVLIHRHVNRGAVCYVLQDQVSGAAHRLSGASYVVVAAMDGAKTVEMLWLEAAKRLGDEAPSQDELIALVSQLHVADLLHIDTPPDALAAMQRRAKTDRQKVLRGFLNPLSVRIPLFCPDRALSDTLTAVRWLFSATGVFFWLAVVVPAIILGAQHWRELSDGVSDRILAADNLLLIGLSFAAIKALHELGHGYAVKAFGGTVPEMGVMLLAFLPLPYVDASASSGFSSKWQRIVVSAAGILVEVFLAAMALYIWVLVEQGLVRAMALNAILVAGISTLLVNGNPLLRYDGYYILADLIEIPNLAQRANRYWYYLVDRYLFGISDVKPVAHAPGEQNWFLFYAPASLAYRMLMMFGIALFVASKYMMVGVALAIMSAFMALVLPSAKALSYVLAGQGLHRKRVRAMATTFGLLALAAVMIFWVPAPLRTTTEGVVWLPESAIVRARTDGFVRQLIAKPGSPVSVGTPLVEAEEPELNAQLKTMRARVEELEISLAAERFTDRAKAEVTRIELDQAMAELKDAYSRLDRLTVRSTANGTFSVMLPQDLPGRFVREGEAIGYVLPAGSRSIRAVVGQDDIDLVRTKLKGVSAILSERQSEVVPVTLVREVPAGMDALPSAALSSLGGGSVPLDPREPNSAKTLNRIFQIDLELPEDASPSASFGSRVHVRFEHDWEPVGWQIWRRLRQLFLTRLNT